jgi:uncharacterized C2H2 Zn-finger protein
MKIPYSFMKAALHPLAKMQIARPAPVNQQALRALSFKRKGKRPFVVRLSRTNLIACPICNLKFPQNKLTRHFRATHAAQHPDLLNPSNSSLFPSPKFLICPICNVWFKRKNFGKHVRSKHPASAEESWMQGY